MSGDQEAFLTRWSRRKRAAEKAEPAATRVPSEPDAAPSERSERADAADAAPAPPNAPPDTPAVDLSALPSIESITAQTDIRAFLAAGVPTHLTRAALRRVWVADPAIRDFVGLSENAWNFTAPETIPGFGPAVPPDVARRLVAGILEEVKPDLTRPPVEPAETMTKPDLSEATEASPQRADVEEEPVTDPVDTSASKTSNVDVAAHKEEAPDRPARLPRVHGGALPR
jgi:hypothetical protein